MKVLAFFEFGDVSASRYRWVHTSWALFGILLMLATWRLWIPQRVYPQIPLLAPASFLPVACQWGAAVIALFSLLVTWILVMRGGRGIAWPALVYLTAMLLLFLTDQHRLQPWAYQWTIYALVFAWLPADRDAGRPALGLLRLVTLSIYFYSALGKFDYQFLHSVGQQFLGVVVGFLGIGEQTLADWPRWLRLGLAAAFPCGELLIVVALLVPKWRRAGVRAAMVLHAALLLVLGPWGLRHQPGVLIWNAFFIAQVWLLFSGSGTGDSAASGASSHDAARPPTADSRAAPRKWLPTGAVLAVVCLPLLEPWGGFDHWPSWGLYSPRNSRVQVEVHRAGIEQLPAELQAFLADVDDSINWVPLKIDDWSLAALSVPIYPQDRFQLGVAEAIATRYRLDRTIRVHVRGMSDRWTGARSEKTLSGRQQIVAAANRFRLNAHPSDHLP